MSLKNSIFENIEIPDKALSILEEPDRIIQFRLPRDVPEGTKPIYCYLVYHNTARGPPCKGGVRMSREVSQSETCQLAEIMTYKNALVDLPFGGAKAGIVVDNSLERNKKASIMRSFTHEIRHELDTGAYVPAPDLGTGPKEMTDIFAITHDRATVTGKPVGIGGLPGRVESTGYGVASITGLVSEKLLNSDVSEKTVSIQGFGNVGSWVAKFLSDQGATIKAVSTKKGTILEEEGINVEKLLGLKKDFGDECVERYEDGESVELGEELFLNVGILIPAAKGGTIDGDKANDIKADLIVEAANSPTTDKAIELLENKDIPIVPDILANAGGVLASYIEWRGGKSGIKTRRIDTFEEIEKNLRGTFREVLEKSSDWNVSLRKSAYQLGAMRLVKTMRDRGWI